MLQLQLLIMNNSSYNKHNPAISRLDQLLTRNQKIYQNLQQKLQGINRSSHNIHTNINHINHINSNSHHLNYNYSDHFLHESSAIERQPNIKLEQISFNQVQKNEQSPPKNSLPSIQEHSQITFSDYKNGGSEIEQQSREQSKMVGLLKEQQRLRGLQLMLERERLLEQESVIESSKRNSRKDERESVRMNSSSRGEDYKKQRTNIKDYIQEQSKATQREKPNASNYPYKSAHKSQGGLINNQLPQPTISYENSNLQNNITSQHANNHIKSAKNNAIYLHKIPKSSIIQIEGETQIPTFRDINPNIQAFAQQEQEIEQLNRINDELFTRDRQELTETLNKLHEKIVVEMAYSPIKQPQLKRDYSYEHKMRGEQSNRQADVAYSKIIYNRNYIPHQTNRSIDLDNLSAKSRNTPSHEVNTNQKSEKAREYKYQYLARHEEDAKNEIIQLEISKELYKNQSKGKDSSSFSPINKSNIGRTSVSNINSTERGKKDMDKSNGHRNNQMITQCLLFVPFNKVYRSPILQLKQGSVYLQRKSKTTPLTKRQNKMLDPIVYKIKNIITDEAELIHKLMLQAQSIGQKNEQGQKTVKVGIVGGKQVLKKKIHCNLLNRYYELLLNYIQNTDQKMIIKIQHQEIVVNEQPVILQQTIDTYLGSKRVIVMQLDKVISDVIEMLMKSHPARNVPKKLIRITKFEVFRNGLKAENYSVISSNRYDLQFLKLLRVNKVCFAINPLVKYYQQVKGTLEGLKAYLKSQKTR